MEWRNISWHLRRKLVGSSTRWCHQSVCHGSRHRPEKDLIGKILSSRGRLPLAARRVRRFRPAFELLQAINGFSHFAEYVKISGILHNGYDRWPTECLDFLANVRNAWSPEGVPIKLSVKCKAECNRKFTVQMFESENNSLYRVVLGNCKLGCFNPKHCITFLQCRPHMEPSHNVLSGHWDGSANRG